MWLFILIGLETIFPPGEGAGNQFDGINFDQHLGKVKISSDHTGSVDRDLAQELN